MIIAVASGKGGTGKTLVSTNLALSITDQSVQLLDCDVEEPNAHIFFTAKPIEEEIATLPIPKVNQRLCQKCGKCTEVCAYNAIGLFGESLIIFEDLCHSCAACWSLCPYGAITTEEKEIGKITRGQYDNVTLYTGKMRIGSHASPPLIKRVKEHVLPEAFNILDGPPGSSCPVMETVDGADYCILVTEPTPFGLNDLSLAVEMIQVLGVPCGVVINRDGPDSSIIEEYCQEKGIKILMRIPFDEQIARIYAKGNSLIKENPEWQKKFAALYQKVVKEVLR